jgi:hypothetical protein
MKSMMMTGISAVIGAGNGSTAQSSNAPQRSGEMTHRTLGRTGERVSVIGMGGFHIGQPRLSEDETLRLVRFCFQKETHSVLCVYCLETCGNLIGAVHS